MAKIAATIVPTELPIVVIPSAKCLFPLLISL